MWTFKERDNKAALAGPTSLCTEFFQLQGRGEHEGHLMHCQESPQAPLDARRLGEFLHVVYPLVF